MIASNNMNFNEATGQELESGRYIKYIYQNEKYNKEEIKKKMDSRQFELSVKDIYYVEI